MTNLQYYKSKKFIISLVMALAMSMMIGLVSQNKDGWYLQGKQPSGFVKYPYKNGCSVARTSSVNKDKVTFYAQWKKK